MAIEVIEKIIESLKNWWKNFTMSSEERWLSQSADIVDLEQKLVHIWNKQHNSYNNYGNYNNHIGGF